MESDRGLPQSKTHAETAPDIRFPSGRGGAGLSIGVDPAHAPRSGVSGGKTAS
jgi:hypothetical protein